MNHLILFTFKQLTKNLLELTFKHFSTKRNPFPRSISTISPVTLLLVSQVIHFLMTTEITNYYAYTLNFSNLCSACFVLVFLNKTRFILKYWTKQKYLWSFKPNQGIRCIIFIKIIINQEAQASSPHCEQRLGKGNQVNIPGIYNILPNSFIYLVVGYLKFLPASIKYFAQFCDSICPRQN